MDRRIRKTREAIFEAFVGLIAEKSFDKITINEIANRANVNRGTVYSHYMDKFDLLDQFIETHLIQLFEICQSDGESAHFSPKDLLLRTFEYLGQHTFFYATLLTNKDIPAFRNRLKAMTLRSINEQIDMNGINGDMNKEILAQFLSSAIVGVMEWWITHSMPYPAQDMVEQLWSLLERIQMLPQSVDEDKPTLCTP